MTFLTFLGMFLNLPMLIFVIVLAAIATAIWFTPTLGPAYLLSLATDARVWIGIALVVGGIVLWHSSQTIQKQQQVIAVQQQNTQASTDTQAVITDDVKKKQTRVVQQQNEQHAIDTAPVGDQEDALLDVIARENGQPTVAPTPAPQK